MKRDPMWKPTGFQNVPADRRAEWGRKGGVTSGWISQSKTRHARECPHCGKVGRGLVMVRWHFDNCRQKT